jgi:hypothetical protein
VSAGKREALRIEIGEAATELRGPAYAIPFGALWRDERLRRGRQMRYQTAAYAEATRVPRSLGTRGEQSRTKARGRSFFGAGGRE